MLDGYSLHAVCALLRFLYWPEEACKDSFSQLESGPTLAEVVRLAQMLDAPSLLAKLERHVADTGRVRSGLPDRPACCQQARK